MPSKSPDDELKLTRRLFMQHTAVIAATSASLIGIALKTDALVGTAEAQIIRDGRGTGMPYPYL